MQIALSYFNNSESTYTVQYNTSILYQLSFYKVNWPPYSPFEFYPFVGAIP